MTVRPTIEQIRVAFEVVCPICQADIGCACDQFQAPYPLPFTAHDQRVVDGFGLDESLATVLAKCARAEDGYPLSGDKYITLTRERFGLLVQKRMIEGDYFEGAKVTERGRCLLEFMRMHGQNLPIR